MWNAALGGSLLVFGARKRGLAGFAATLTGAGLLAAAFAPRLGIILDRSAERRRQLTVTGDFVVPRERAAVFAFVRNFENFPLLGGVLHSVDDFDDGRSRWRILGPDGTMVEWNVIVTKYVPPRVLAWESVPDAAVECDGTVRFEALDDQRTRVDLRVHYRARTPEAVRVFRRLVARRPDTQVRAAIDGIEAAMRTAEDPEEQRREPQFPLPERERRHLGADDSSPRIVMSRGITA